MKKVFNIILCVIIALLLGGSAFALWKSMDYEEVEPDVPVEEVGGFELEASPDEDQLVTSKMSMLLGAEMFMGDGSLSTPVKLRFTCVVNNEFADEVLNNSKKTLGMLVAPLDTLEAVNTNHYRYVDWIKEFDKAGRNIVVQTVNELEAVDNEISKMTIVVDGISYENMNRKYVALGVMVDASSGENVYKYSQFSLTETYRDHARSAAYLASATMNGHAMGTHPISDENYALMEHFLDMSIDCANGLSMQTPEKEKFEVFLPEGREIDLIVGGETYQFEIQVEPKELDVAIHYQSMDSQVAIVNSEGQIFQQQAGQTTVKVFIAGEVYEFTVNVSQDTNEE